MPSIGDLVHAQQTFFRTGTTRIPAYRIEALKRLHRNLAAREEEAFDALWSDLRKPRFEAYGSEIGFVLNELRTAIARTTAWARPHRSLAPLVLFPASSKVIPEPFGVVLIISPWNYPLMLALSPLIGAVAAGNCAVVKPSESAPHTSAFVLRLVRDSFPEEHVAVIEGGPTISKRLLREKFNFILYTGGSRVAHEVMKAASVHLTPVALELGGKSPAIVDGDVDIGQAAKRIVWGKFFNAGQTCVAPDYVVVHVSAKERLLAAMKQCVGEFYGQDPSKSTDYGRIIDLRHFNRLISLMKRGRVVVGGGYSKKDLFIEPTIIDGVSWDDPIMKEEIFGPLLPILEYDDFNDVLKVIRNRPRPLSLYIFSNNRNRQRQAVDSIQFGGGCINETLSHFANPRLPFGGIGESGIGRYHGKHTFDLFSHQKSVLRKPTWLDIPIRYPPYRGKLGLVKKILR
ncbi:MAG: aldehyde dehydrogenase [Ignavibacteria bacterium]|nr:aldehyde dehydrogenase [Ignavibacteria bacterium]